MRRLAPRQILGVVGLSLPAVVSLGLGVFFLTREVPKITAGETARVKGEYRLVALALKRGEVKPSATWSKLPKGWRAAGKMAPGRWGFVACGGEGAPAPKTTVWYEYGREDGRKRTVVATEVSHIETGDYAAMFWAGGVFFLVVIVGMTLLGIRFFLGDLKARDDFLGATVHDLTTPLVALRGTIGTSPKDAKVLVDRLLRLVRNVTDFLKLGGRRRPPEPKEIDLVALWKEAYSLFADDFAEEKSGPVVLVAPEKLVAFADEALALQILWNLLGNEFKYAAPYGTVTARLEEGEVVISDSGPGLTAKQRRRIFERYYRAKSATECGRGGFGIGLCTSREFARAMGGDLTVEANASGGTTFRLRLPTARGGAVATD